MNIYKITNTENGKVYIGQTVQKNPKMRWYQHCADARNGKDSHLCSSMRKYGIDKFLWEVIDTVTTLDQLNEKEAYWLDYFKQFTECYNIRDAGGNKLHNPESIEKMRSAQKAAHARRRAEGRDGGWKRIDGGPMKGKVHPRKGTSGLWNMPESAKERIRQIQLENSGTRGKTWKLINGKRVYTEKT